jgi:hypothetical protein
MRALTVGLLLASLAGAAGAATKEQRDLQGMSVFGNRELPKALYILPWQGAEPGGGAPTPHSSLFDRELGPLDPEVFRREVQYYDALRRGH